MPFFLFIPRWQPQNRNPRLQSRQRFRFATPTEGRSSWRVQGEHDRGTVRGGQSDVDTRSQGGVGGRHQTSAKYVTSYASRRCLPPLGGVAEIFRSTPSKEILLLRERKARTYHAHSHVHTRSCIFNHTLVSTTKEHTSTERTLSHASMHTTAHTTGRQPDKNSHTHTTNAHARARVSCVSRWRPGPILCPSTVSVLVCVCVNAPRRT